MTKVAVAEFETEVRTAHELREFVMWEPQSEFETRAQDCGMVLSEHDVYKDWESPVTDVDSAIEDKSTHKFDEGKQVYEISFLRNTIVFCPKVNEKNLGQSTVSYWENYWSGWTEIEHKRAFEANFQPYIDWDRIDQNQQYWVGVDCAKREPDPGRIKTSDLTVHIQATPQREWQIEGIEIRDRIASMWRENLERIVAYSIEYSGLHGTHRSLCHPNRSRELDAFYQRA